MLLVISFISCASKEKTNNQPPNFMEVDSELVKGEYIVTMNEAVNEEFLYEVFSANKVSYVEKITDRIFLIRLEIDPGPSEIYKKYLENDSIKTIQPNFKYEVEPTERSQMTIQE
jgi:hypothetical protein